MKIKLVSDSSCDVKALPGVEFQAVPLSISTEERTFYDDENLNVSEMMDYLAHYKSRSYTACPSMADWLEAFGDAEEIYVTTMTSNLSGTYNSAVTAAQQYMEEHPGRKVFVLDTLSTSAEMLMILEKIAELKQAGCSFEEIAQQAEAYRKTTRLFFAFQSLHNFAQNGRVPKLLAKTIGVLGISIIGTASEQGTVEPISKSRGKKSVLNNLMEQLKKAGYCGGKLYVAQAEGQELAEEFVKLVKTQYPNAATKIYPVRGLCAYYAEKGGLIIGCECGKA